MFDRGVGAAYTIMIWIYHLVGFLIRSLVSSVKVPKQAAKRAANRAAREASGAFKISETRSACFARGSV